MAMHWVYLFAAIVLEVSGTTAMKVSAGFTRLVPSLVMAVCYALSLASLTMALKGFNVSVAYAIWAGLGTALVSCVGIFYFREPAPLLKLACIGLIILGVVGLHLSDSTH